MKKFTVPCQFGSQTAPFTIYIGSPRRDTHPIYNQATWLSKERGGVVPQKVMDSLSKLRELAEENNVSFEDLCVYALKVAEQEETQPKEEEFAFDGKQTNE
ncbi:DUF2610 domain-containing protein [Neorickettsia sennetsu]|uniref:DUF2610 domain-containing protein n=1 Tax=Ehrlichia sennetsu (strain ATCC VR-367 / Miyayama) TaxID=222891 RepID=Q2GCJ4_EHRS3|nr:DUF2610 domain-containing protein [Neorickettsia sennetsu]ABD46521.1 conserved hypothetical protein [Neorickettsia sennetsu str. Miyayama]